MKFWKKLFSQESEKEGENQLKKLLEDESPLSPITAIVEQDNRVAHFYLIGAESTNFGMKSCWIRNLQDAPEFIVESEISQGLPPMQTSRFCKSSATQKPLVANDLSVLWLEEGNAAALYEGDQLLAIIPSWSGQNGFFGYSNEAKGQGPFAWEINPENDLLNRLNAAKSSIQEWDSEPNPFQIKQVELLEYYQELLGEQDGYYAIDGGHWPPKGLYLRKGEHQIVFATIGLSLIPQPLVEQYFENRFEHHRIELGLILNANCNEEEIQGIANYISGQASLPWDQITFLAEGHTIGIDLPIDERFTSVLLTNQLNILPKINLPNYKGAKINFYWMVPITELERKIIMENGSKALIAKLNEIGKEIYNQNRIELA